MRFAAFTDTPTGGNLAGVSFHTHLPDDAWMQQTAAQVGYSETVFLAPSGTRRWTVRYFSPEAEVPFCGHATIAAGVALGVTENEYLFETRAGLIPVEVGLFEGNARATLTSVEPSVVTMSPDTEHELLTCFGWRASDVVWPLRVAFAGARHPIVALTSRGLLQSMTYDFERLKRLMQRETFTTVQVVFQEGADVFFARNPFPVGGVVEDAATGAAAAALGGYLRLMGRLEAPATIAIHQGVELGRPSLLNVEIPLHGGIRVSGHAVGVL